MEKTIGLILSLAGVIGTLVVILKLLPAYILALNGNYANATNIVIDVSAEEIISKVYWAIFVAIASPIVGFLIHILRK